MSDYRSARDRSPTPFPREVVDSSSDTDPTEEYMESEDSSIQVLPPPPRSPPVVIDLTAPSPLRAETVDPVDTTLGIEEPVTSVYAALPDLTQVPTLSAPLTTSVPVLTTESQDDHVMAELDRHFHPTLPEITAMITGVPDATLPAYETLTPAEIGATIERVPPPIPTTTDQIPPIHVIAELEMHVPLTIISPMLGSSGPEAPVCDTAPPTPTIPVSAVTTGLGGLFAPFPVTATGQMEDTIATVPAFLFEELRLSYDELYARYHEVFITRDALLRMIATSRPAAPVVEDGLVRRSEVIDVMHQTATSVITGLQSAIAELPSSSAGAVDQGAVAALVELTRCEFLSRVDEMFRPH